MNDIKVALTEYLDKELTAPDEDVYHYTDDDGYLGICRTRSFYLNSHSNLNNKNIANQELQTGYDLVKENMQRSKKLRHEVNVFENFFKRGIVYYTASFSKSKSHYNMSKYCIKVSNKLLRSYANAHKEIFFADVIYAQNRQDKIIKRMFELYNNEAEIAHNQDNERQTEIRCDLFELVSIILPLFKNIDHEQDDECRIVCAEIFNPINGDLLTPLVSKKIDFFDHDIKPSVIYYSGG